MKINYNIILWFYLLSQIAAAKVMSLEEIKYHAHKNNFVLNAARFDTKAHEKNEAQQIAKLLPKVGLRAGVEKTKNDTTKDTEHTKQCVIV